MYVPVWPPTPTSALIAGLVAAGYQPIPIENLDDVAAKMPELGWAAAVVEITEDVGRCLSVAAKLKTEFSLPVLVVIDRTMTTNVSDDDSYTDFILSPLDRAELQARLGRITLIETTVTDDDILRYRDLELNTATYQTTVGGDPRDLTFMEYELLRFFVENQGRVWSRDQILKKVWGYDYFGGARTVDVHVRRLRSKLGEERSSWITTVRSVGYRFG